MVILAALIGIFVGASTTVKIEKPETCYANVLYKKTQDVAKLIEKTADGNYILQLTDGSVTKVLLVAKEDMEDGTVISYTCAKK